MIYYLVAQRTRDIGIRVASGADRGRMVRLVLRQGVVLALAGIAGGLVGAVMLSKLLIALRSEYPAPARAASRSQAAVARLPPSGRVPYRRHDRTSGGS